MIPDLSLNDLDEMYYRENKVYTSVVLRGSRLGLSLQRLLLEGCCRFGRTLDVEVSTHRQKFPLH